jgi:hypothetical protein
MVLYRSTETGYLRVKIQGESPFLNINTKDLEDFIKMYKDINSIEILNIIDRTYL